MNRLGVTMLVSGVFFTGCAAQPTEKAAVPVALAVAKPDGVDWANALAQDTSHTLQGGERTVRSLRLDCYQISVPHGAVSRSREFWKRVDENQVDPGTYDLLLKNGLRVGVAPNSEWSYFKEVISQYNAVTRQSAVAGDGGLMELPLNKGIDFQNIFYFSDRGVLFGRTYEKCDNLLNVTYRPAPRKADVVRLKVCPTVRGVRRQFKVTSNGDEREIEYVHPEQLYDLNLEADVPIDSFLVLAPSELAELPTSLGRTFFIADGPAERTETVLLLVPRNVMLEEQATLPPPPTPKVTKPQKKK